MATASWTDICALAADGDLELKDGEYTVRLVHCGTGSSATGKDKFVLTFQIVGTEQKFKTTQYVSPESRTALGIFFRMMGKFGADKDFFRTNPSKAEVAARIVGDQTYRVTIKNEEFQGRDTIKLSSVRKIDLGNE